MKPIHCPRVRHIVSAIEKGDILYIRTYGGVERDMALWAMALGYGLWMCAVDCDTDNDYFKIYLFIYLRQRTRIGH